jgi:glycosyltransferase involved in cell wall biosynthesis
MPETPRPLVSVVTPVLNSVSSLELTLLSVAAQTYPNIEHIVIDGGSSDGTVDLLRCFRSAVRLRWLSEPDAGMYAAVNKGIRLARGEVISYLNSDDLYLPWSVDRAVSALSSPRIDIAFGDLLVLARQEGVGHGLRIQFYPPFHLRTYAYEVSMAQPTVFWRRRVSEMIGGFDDRLRYAGDFEYWLRTGVAGFRYTHVREIQAVSVEHERALSSVYADELQREIERVRARYAAAVREGRFIRLRLFSQLFHWRAQVLLLRFNLRRRRPSSWVSLIQFLRREGMDLDGSSIVPLFMPLPLPKAWSPWRLDPEDFERKLTAELRVRASAS